jgi:hypothetical protein
VATTRNNSYREDRSIIPVNQSLELIYSPASHHIASYYHDGLNAAMTTQFENTPGE